MTTTTATTRRGQAAVECAIAIMLFAFAILALVQFGMAFLGGTEMMDHARADAGEGAINKMAGVSQGSKTETFDLDLVYFGDKMFQDGQLRLREEATLPGLRLK